MNQQDAIEEIFSLLKTYYTTDVDKNFLDYQSPSELTNILNLEEQDAQGNLKHTISWVKQYLQYGIRSNHPSFMNRMWAGANLPSILGELTVAFSNTSACTYESAPVSTLMENYMIQQMLELAGFKNGEGQMTTGSSNANMIAMMSARNTISTQVKEKGLFSCQNMYAFVNKDAHYSMDKAANILGIGIDNLIKIPVNENGEMRIDALESELKAITSKGGLPFFVAATAGTTVRGAYDPITPLFELRDQYNFWLHVDGAWGGAAVMSESLRKKYLTGLEQADSFTCDFHKMLGSALMCNFLLINNKPKIFNKVLSGGDGSYLFRNSEDDNVVDTGTSSLQCGRRVDALKWFLDWKYYGKEGFGKRIENYLTLCKYAEEVIHKTPELELVAPRTSFNLCFRYKVNEDYSNNFNQELRTRLYTSGTNLVGIAFVEQKLTLRFLICNLTIEEEAVNRFFDQVLEVGRQLEKEGFK
ncbi:MAG: PLP-dependent decarboxylase [Desulfotalea sp.]